MKSFFVSYNQADRAWAEWIAWMLEEEGHTTVVQAWDFRPGSNFVLEMQKAAAEAERTIALLSPEYLAARFTQPEWAAAFAQDPTGEKGKLLPVRVKACDLEGLLPQIVYIDLVGADEVQARSRLLAGVDRGRAKPGQRPAFPSSAVHSVTDRPRFPGSLPPVWNLAHHRNPNFTGREAALSELHAALNSGRAGEAVQAITGLGGKGKTQLATEYAYRHAADYDAVWWVRAEEPTTMAADLAALAHRLGVADREERDQRVVTEAVHAWLRSNRRWLLIFDNAEDAKELRGYLPQGHQGHLIITTRNPRWEGIAASCALEVLTREESVEFLCRRTKQTDRAGADALAEELGDLPLALEQAAAYIVAAGRSISDYLELFRRRQRELLRRGEPSTEYPDTVATTWEVSFQELEKHSPAAADLLRLFAFLAPDDIPSSLLREQADLLPEPLSGVVKDDLDHDEAVMALRRYSLVEGTSETLSVHLLVQAVARHRLDKEAGKTWAAVAVRILNRAFPQRSDDFRFWPVCASLLPHTLSASGHAEERNAAPEECGRLLNQIGLYLQERAQFADARTSLERALRIAEAAYGPEHPNVAVVLSNLGTVLEDLGELPAAQEHLERALRITEAAYGSEHPDVARCLGSLGMVLKDLGKLSAARAHLERALQIAEASYGTEHPSVANCLGPLGAVFQNLGELPAARAHLERALQIAEASYGTEHPSVADCLNNLGLTLMKMGELPPAREHLERALRITEAVYGPEHPSVARYLNHLGILLKELGELDVARAHLERALRTTEAAYGPKHPEVANRLSHLGLVLQGLGELNAARDRLERALGIAEAVYGPEHPNVAVTRSNFGTVLRDLGELSAAREHLKRAVEVFRNSLGDDHPSTRIAKRNLDSLDS